MTEKGEIMQRSHLRKVSLVLGLALSMLLGSLPAAQAAVACGETALACRVGQSLIYDYDAIFTSEADVETVATSGYNSATLTGEATVSLTAVASQDNLCTYAVQLSEVAVAELVEDKTVESAGEQEIGETINQVFYFTQASDGQIVDVTVGREDIPEVITFKRGLVNALNLTLRADDQYEVFESDISGSYSANYSVSRGEREVVLSRTKSEADYTAGKNGRKLAQNIALTHTSSINFSLESCVISQVNIDELVIIAQPDASDPVVSAHYHHETVKVRAAVNMTLTAMSMRHDTGKLRQGLRRGDMLRLPVAAAIGLSTVDEDNSEQIAELVERLHEQPSHGELLSGLSQAVRGDAAGISHLSRHIERLRPTGRFARSLASLLISEGSVAAQATLVDHLLGGAIDADTAQRILGLSTLLDAPSPALVAAVAAIAGRHQQASWPAATLALGAYADALSDAGAKRRAAALVEDLNAGLRFAADADEAVLYMRALGNAGFNSSLGLLTPYLGSKDMLSRLSAVVAMRKIESPRIEELLLGHYPNEPARSVRKAIQQVIAERAEAGLSTDVGYARDVLIDWSWSDTFGGNIASATFSASALVEDEPYLIDLQAGAEAQVFGNQFDIAEVQLLTERISAQERRFRFFIMLVGNEIANIDDTEVCTVDAANTLWEESVDLFDISSPPIPIAGPLTLSFTVTGALEFYVNFYRDGGWCTANDDLQVGLTPGVNLYVDGYATLSLLIVRGGIGIDGTVVGINFPIYADAEMFFQDAPTVCFKIDAQLVAADMELYAWAQYWTFWSGWNPDPRPHWTLWSFDLSPDAWNLLTVCGSNPDLHCLPDVLWWDGSTIDAWWDNANCVVTSPPAGSTPFIANNGYYIESESSCPTGYPWDGNGCVDTVVNPFGASVTLITSGAKPQLRLLRLGGPIPACPFGWTTVTYIPGVYRLCETTPPAGYTGSDYYGQYTGGGQYTVYIQGSGSCDEGILDGSGCWLGSAPAGTNAFYLSGTNAYYYQEP